MLPQLQTIVSICGSLFGLEGGSGGDLATLAIQPYKNEGPEGVKWEQGFAYFFTEKIILGSLGSQTKNGNGIWAIK